MISLHVRCIVIEGLQKHREGMPVSLGGLWKGFEEIIPELSL